MEFVFELNTRGRIPFPQAIMYYFCLLHKHQRPKLERRERISTNNLGLRMVNALPFIRQPDQNGKKASDVSAADWQYQIHVKNYRYFTRVQFDFSLGWKSL